MMTIDVYSEWQKIPLMMMKNYLFYVIHVDLWLYFFFTFNKDGQWPTFCINSHWILFEKLKKRSLHFLHCDWDFIHCEIVISNTTLKKLNSVKNDKDTRKIQSIKFLVRFLKKFPLLVFQSLPIFYSIQQKFNDDNTKKH